MSWSGYGKTYQIGHGKNVGLFYDPVGLEEKIDGSCVSFGVFDGELKIRSTEQVLNLDTPEKLFEKAVQSIKQIAPTLTPGLCYRGEYLQKPKHNTLCYNRIPKNNIIIFDIEREDDSLFTYEEKKKEAERIGLECVPQLYYGPVESEKQITDLFDTISVLGGQKIEGVVAKNVIRKLRGKLVSDRFKEVHRRKYNNKNPGKKEIINAIIWMHKTESRWEKAIQHLRERGELQDDPKDIGALLKEINLDILKECGEDIKEQLWKWAWPQIARGVINGFPQWYKARIMKDAFVPEEKE